jgi:hypothetical protein
VLLTVTLCSLWGNLKFSEKTADFIAMVEEFLCLEDGCLYRTCVLDFPNTDMRSIIIIIIITIIIIIIIIYNCNWVDTRWQLYSTQNTQNGTYITGNILEIRAVPCLCELYARICLKTEEKVRKPLS